jgi:hypothetical protein
VDVVQQPTLLIIVPGIEPQYQIQFKNPTNGQTKTLAANTRWGVGITDSSIQAIVAQVIGRQAAYDIVVCAAYSTGYLGFSGSVSRQLFSLAAIERAIVFDCLYAQLGQSLLAIRQAKSSAKIVCYVASLGGNSFQPGQAPSFQSLLLGGNPAFNYINLFFNTNYYSVASARIINEAVSPGNLIISAIPKPFETAFNNLTAKLPPRGTIVSDAGVYKAVKGTMPSNATALSDFSRTNASLVAPYFAQNTIVHQCIQNAELLGWSTPPGEEWHDMLLVEFSWEYLV